ncbi:hypothetical protein [Mesorhizobium sp.]|uniref:hypothetical protein n=1 Tax=Mesorhizobium sp. TaxID=1871066 RepID=UPI00257BB438|nr:hypothetical protein [Mesorhizobium sp.]
MNEAGFANAGKSGQCRLKRLFLNLEPMAINLPRSMPPPGGGGRLGVLKSAAFPG